MKLILTQDQYEEGAAYYEALENDVNGVGPAYLLLVYEGVVNSIHAEHFKMEPREVL